MAQYASVLLVWTASICHRSPEGPRTSFWESLLYTVVLPVRSGMSWMCNMKSKCMQNEIMRKQAQPSGLELCRYSFWGPRCILIPVMLPWIFMSLCVCLSLSVCACPCACVSACVCSLTADSGVMDESVGVLKHKCGACVCVHACRELIQSVCVLKRIPCINRTCVRIQMEQKFMQTQTSRSNFETGLFVSDSCVTIKRWAWMGVVFKSENPIFYEPLLGIHSVVMSHRLSGEHNRPWHRQDRRPQHELWTSPRGWVLVVLAPGGWSSIFAKKTNSHCFTN